MNLLITLLSLILYPLSHATTYESTNEPIENILQNNPTKKEQPISVGSTLHWGYEIKIKDEYFDTGLPKLFTSYCDPKEDGKAQALVNCMHSFVLDGKIEISINVYSSNSRRNIVVMMKDIENNKSVMRHFEGKTYEDNTFRSGTSKIAKDNMYTFEFKLMP